MPRCCSSPRATAVAFEGGVVLHRCAAHEQQSWTLDGREVARTDALAHLRSLFTGARGRRDASPAVVRQPQPALVPQVIHLPADAPTDERLTALLQSRGLQGSWAVA